MLADGLAVNQVNCMFIVLGSNASAIHPTSQLPTGQGTRPFLKPFQLPRGEYVASGKKECPFSFLTVFFFHQINNCIITLL